MFPLFHCFVINSLQQSRGSHVTFKESVNTLVIFWLLVQYVCIVCETSQNTLTCCYFHFAGHCAKSFSGPRPYPGCKCPPSCHGGLSQETSWRVATTRAATWGTADALVCGTGRFKSITELKKKKPCIHGVLAKCYWFPDCQTTLRKGSLLPSSHINIVSKSVEVEM